MSHSHSAIGNELRHRLRNDLNHAEALEDVEKAFAYAVRNLLVQALGDQLRFLDEDIQLLPEEAAGYRLGEAITADPRFKAARAESDLLAIIGRFAESASHRHQSLSEHENKIRARIHKQH